MKKNIPYSMPSITSKEVAYAKDAAENGGGSKCYEYIDRFEQLFAEHLGVKHAIATSSCTGAIHMGLSAIGIGPGDEVVMGDTNWIDITVSLRSGLAPELKAARKLKAEIKPELEYIRAWGGCFVAAVPALRIAP